MKFEGDFVLYPLSVQQEYPHVQISGKGDPREIRQHEPSALRSMCQKSTVHIKISIHIPTSQINAVRYISSEKNIIDQKKFIPSCKA